MDSHTCCTLPLQPIIKNERMQEFADTIQTLDQAMKKVYDNICAKVEHQPPNQVEDLKQALQVGEQDLHKMRPADAAVWIKQVWQLCQKDRGPSSLSEQVDILTTTFTRDMAMRLTQAPTESGEMDQAPCDIALVDDQSPYVKLDLSDVIAVKNMVVDSKMDEMVRPDPECSALRPICGETHFFYYISNTACLTPLA
jgi:hypothetical protein